MSVDESSFLQNRVNSVLQLSDAPILFVSARVLLFVIISNYMQQICMIYFVNAVDITLSFDKRYFRKVDLAVDLMESDISFSKIYDWKYNYPISYIITYEYAFLCN